jgi:hypothetical protein
MRDPRLAGLEEAFGILIPDSVHAFLARPTALEAWTVRSVERLAESSPSRCLGFLALLRNPAGDEAGLYYPPDEREPLVVQRGHEEDVLFVIEERVESFLASPRAYLRQADWFGALPEARHPRWEPWLIREDGHPADELLKPFHLAPNSHLLDRERDCFHRRQSLPERSKGCVLEPLFDRMRERWDSDPLCGMFRALVSEPGDVEDWSRWYHLGRKLQSAGDLRRAAAAYLNSMTRTALWANVRMILAKLEDCVRELGWTMRHEQIRRWTPIVDEWSEA